VAVGAALPDTAAPRELTSAACDVLLCSSLGTVVGIVGTENNLHIRSSSSSSFTSSIRGRTCNRLPSARSSATLQSLSQPARPVEFLVVDPNQTAFAFLFTFSVELLAFEIEMLALQLRGNLATA